MNDTVAIQRHFQNLNLWVLSNYRSGSIFVCNMLEKVGGFSEPEFFERFNPRRPATLRQYYSSFPLWNAYQKWQKGTIHDRRQLFFEHVIQRGRLPARMKIMRDQYLTTCGLLDSDKELIEYLLPNLKYIFIRRSDLLRITISYYFALKTGKWVVNRDERSIYLNQNVDYNPTELLNLYRIVKRFVRQNNWEHYLGESDHYFLNFEELIDDPISCFSELFEHLGVDSKKLNVEKLIDHYEYIPTKRPETDAYVERLRLLVDESEYVPDAADRDLSS